MLGRALARTRGHGEHSLAPTGRMNRNGDCDRVKRHHGARVHVLRPFETLARVVIRVAHGGSSVLEPPRITQCADRQELA